LREIMFVWLCSFNVAASHTTNWVIMALGPVADAFF
jgi:hypothetical protein